jgi:hypothetical protein
MKIQDSSSDIFMVGSPHDPSFETHAANRRRADDSVNAVLSHRTQLTKLVLLLVLLAALPCRLVAAGFLTPPTYPTSQFPNWATTADFNSDGHLDLATANQNTVSILLNNGDGSFAAPIDFPAGQQPMFLLAADVNSDGKQDLVGFDLDNLSKLFILLGNGDGSFQPAFIVNAGALATFVAAGDFNRDGNLDLVVGGTSLQDKKRIAVLLGNGDGTFQPPVGYQAGVFPEFVITEDFNRDGKLDLAVANYDPSSISILMGNGDGTFQPATDYAVGDSPRFIAAGDLNSDGKLDLVVVNVYSYDLSILLGNGDGSFQPARSQSVGRLISPWAVLIADLNHDGQPDLAVLSGGVCVLLNKGDGTFQVPELYSAGSGGFSMVAGDFNEDGNLDFAEPSLIAKDVGGVAVLLGNGNGTFRSSREYPGAGLWSLAVGDLNGDGKADLVTSSQPPNTFAMVAYLGRGDGSFGPVVRSPVGPFSHLALGDFNLDGKLDLAAPALCDPRCVFAFSILLGNGDGSFQPPASYSSFMNANFIGVGDFNGDGKPDLAVSSDFASVVGIFLGNGDGSFQNGQNYSLPNPASLAIGDFNRDGKLDLAIPNAGGITILFGKGDGTFQTAGTYSAANGAIATGDFNHDGKLDLAVTDFTPDQVDVLLGNGDGTFGAAVKYDVGYQPTAMVVVDVNGDKKLDLAVANILGSSVSVLLGNGDGTFQATTNYSNPPALAMAVADFNRDGAPDLVTAHSYLTVLLNDGGTFPSTTSSANPSKLGQAVTFTTTVKPTFAFIGTPTGTVTFKAGSTTLGKVALTGGEASLTTSSLSLGKHKISAFYSGDGNFNPNTAPVLVQKVIR